MDTIQIHKDFTLVLNNGLIAKFKYMSDFDNPIFSFTLPKKQIPINITIIDNKLYTVTPEDEPDSPLKEEYQTKFLEEYQYNFFKGYFIKYSTL